MVATERTRLLIDAGLSRKETFERLAAIGVASDTLTAILITHEHSDHIAGLQVIARKLEKTIRLSWSYSRPAPRFKSAISMSPASPFRMTRPIR